MDKKQNIDLFGAVALSGFSLLMAINQVVIKITTGGLQPVFFAGLRSFGALLCLYLWMRWRGKTLRIDRAVAPAGFMIGAFFAFEFIGLFVALDLTTVSRSGVIFYSMPVWLAIIAHFTMPDDRVNPRKALGLALAFCGVAVAILVRGETTGGSLWGDLAALGGAIGWAMVTYTAKATRLSRESPEMQLFWQLACSAPILLLASLFAGPLVRELAAIHIAGLAFQIVFVAFLAFMFWFWLLAIYPASGVASFAFLTPVLSVLLGWLFLEETVGPSLWVALGLVASGLFLINRPARSRRTSA